MNQNMNSLSGADAREVTPLHRVCDNINSSTHELLGVVDMIENRLSPICRSVPQAVAKEADRPQTATSPIVASLQELNKRIDDASTRLHRLLQMCEV